jgi:dihydrofolate synthase/folylpolyglutamate synthase
MANYKMKLPTWPQPNGINKINFGLERIKILLGKLGNPQNTIAPVFHVAGTNGKGSTTAFIKYILEENGYRVHRYISPHLVRFNERIEICGKEITDEYYYELAYECKEVIEKNNIEVSYFEIITAIAFMAFSRNRADAVVLEVGLGGRLDATNVIESPLVTIITPLSLDHTRILGDTVEKIAIEKFGIAKNGCPIILSKQDDVVTDLLTLEAKKNSCPIYVYEKEWNYKQFNDHCTFEGFSKIFKTPLPSMEGKHQMVNAGTAIASILCQNKLKVTDEAIGNGIVKTFWKARLQNLSSTKLSDFVPTGSELYLDGGHNEGGARIIRDWIEYKQKNDARDNVMIISMLERKDTKTFIEILKNAFQYVIVVSNNSPEDDEYSKYKSGDDFKKEFEEIGVTVLETCKNIVSAMEITKTKIKSKKDLRILICGSLYFSGDVLSLIENY